MEIDRRVRHIGMMNAYNIITGKVGMDEVLSSGLPVVVLGDRNECDFDMLSCLIKYFKEFEDFEKCDKVKKIMDAFYNEDGTQVSDVCLCDYPEPNNYSPLMTCKVCSKQLTSLIESPDSTT